MARPTQSKSRSFSQPSGETALRKAEATKARIIHTAERLFATHGLDGISLREVSRAASQGNNNAVQYHFRTKEGLISAILDLRSQVLDRQRHDLLIQAARDGKLGDLETLLRITYLPPAELVDEKGRHTYARFLHHFMLDLVRWRGIAVTRPYENPTSVATTTLQCIRAIFPKLPDQVISARLRRGGYMILSALIEWENDPTPLKRKWPKELVLQDVLATIVAGFGAPVNPNLLKLAEAHQ